SLMLMNNPFVLEQSGAMADRVAAEGGDDPDGQVRLAWRLAFARTPTEGQLDGALAYLDAQRDALADAPVPEEGEAPDPGRRALASLCHALLCSNGFLYVD